MLGQSVVIELSIIVVVCLIFVGFFAFWLWMLIDCIQKESPEGNEKLTWVIVIALLGWLGALIYLLMRRPERIRQIGR